MVLFKTIKLRRGLKVNLPVLQVGEPGYASDAEELYIGSTTGNVKVTNTTEMGELSENLANIAGVGRTTETVKGISDGLGQLSLDLQTQISNANSLVTNLAGVGRTTETIKSNADKINNKIKLSTFTATVDGTTNIVYGLVYNPAKDDLLVFYGGLLLDIGINYNNNVNNISVDLLVWSVNIGEKIMFKLYKDVK